MRKKDYFIYFILFYLSLFTYGSSLKGLNFEQKGSLSYLNLLFDQENIKISKHKIISDKQIILDIENVNATKKVMRPLDTSEFSGAVVLISSYRRPENPRNIRVVLQLRENVRSKLKLAGKMAVLTIENRFGAFIFKNSGKDEGVSDKSLSNEKEITKIHIPKSHKIDDILENLTLAGKKKYIGKKITINVKNTSMNTILEMIADISGFNIIQTSDIKKLKPLSLNLINLPWDQVLDTVLNLNSLVAQKNSSILTIKTFQQALKEQEEYLALNQDQKKEEPLITKIFPISYATGKDVLKILKDYQTIDRGKISYDERTGSILVKDTEEKIEEIKKILKFLDTQTPQVLIESKIVEVYENYSKRIGLNNGLNFGYDPVGSTASSSSSVGESPSTGDNGGPGFSFSSAPKSGENSRNLLGLTIGRFGRLFNLNFELQLLETESQGKIVASPRIVTKHGEKATLTAAQDTSYSVREGSGENAVNTFKTSTSTLGLSVTPIVTNDGIIDLDITLEKQQFGVRPSLDAPPDKSTRKIETNVLVENGSTIVLGGLYDYEKQETHSGVPILKNIPLIGWLFRTPHAPETKKRELIIFITPRIINEEAAGFKESI